MAALTVAPDETDVPLAVTIYRPGIGGVDGLSPTVAVRDVATGWYLDWGDMALKSGSWSLKDAPMVDYGNGHYQRELDISAAPGIVNGSRLIAEYRSTIYAYAGEGHDTIRVLEVVTDRVTEMWRLMGLDPDNELVNDTGLRQVPEGGVLIDQTVTVDGAKITVRRSP
jgi:hypothetical protein